MSTKRVANTELNHDNWNEEPELEDAGEFKKASNDVIQQRVRKVAKRRIATDSDSSGSQPASNPFSGFGGFQQKSLATSTPSPFSFLSKIPPTTNGEAAKVPGIVFNSSAISTNKSESSDDNNNSNTAYYSKIKSLNQAFVDWIKSNVDETKGLCDLTPVFKDYEKYIKECQELKDKKSADIKPAEKTETAPPAATFTFGKPATSTINSSFTSSKTTTSIFGTKIDNSKPKEVSPVKPAAESKTFSFGITPSNSTTSNLSAAPSFSFGLQKTSTAVGGNPIFGNLTSTSSAPFSFSNVTQNTASTENTATNEEEAEEEPPKNEFVPVVEEDSLYSKRCKVFVKSGADYADRGIGTLFLKKVDDKVQLIVRADTNLGNILLNIIICDGLPTSRLGKNNVMIVCLPTPESKPPPIPVLVRVKTADEADELLATLEKYKKA